MNYQDYLQKYGQKDGLKKWKADGNKAPRGLGAMSKEKAKEVHVMGGKSLQANIKALREKVKQLEG